MKAEILPHLRTLRQQIAHSTLKSARETVSWMGAMQAQDFSMSKWAIGLRLPGSKEKTVNEAIDAGEILRTHLLRPTWHLVSSEDIFWMMDLTGPRIRAASSSRDRQLELTDPVIRKTNRIIENALKDHQHKTREELVAELLKSGVRLEDNRAAHILMRAETEGIICSGKLKRGKPTYTLLEEWVTGSRKKFNREEALKELGWRYFNSRGPATTEDFSWWSGLTLKDSRMAPELNRQELLSETVNGRTYWFPDFPGDESVVHNKIDLLPAYDELLIGYRDRSVSLSLVQNKRVVSVNGIFYPSILMKGQVVGTWKRNIKNGGIMLTASLFSGRTKLPARMIDEAIRKYAEFSDKEIEFIGK